MKTVAVFSLVLAFLFQHTGLAYAATITPNMFKRDEPGPFMVTPMVQGDG